MGVASHRRISAKSSGRDSAWPVRLIEGCLSDEVFFRQRQTRSLGKMLIRGPLIWSATRRRLLGVEGAGLALCAQPVLELPARAGLPVSVPVGLEASCVPHVLEWAYV
jgi:hypothetical protein